MNKSDQEVEVKFYISRGKDLEERITSVGGKLKEPRVHEVNLRFDTPSQDLLHSGRLLRLRKDRRVRVTYKGPGGESGGARQRQELEITVSNHDTTQKLLEALGYQVSMMYEKYRTTYELDDLEVVLDQMPYGDFVEIEGKDGAAIQKAAKKLGLDWNARNLDSYTVLFERARMNLGFDFRDLSFENFKGLSVDPEAMGVRVAD